MGSRGLRQAVELGLFVSGIEVIARLLLLQGHAVAVVDVRLAGARTGLLRLFRWRLVHAVFKLSRPDKKT